MSRVFFLPPKNDLEHARGPRNFAYAVNLTYRDGVSEASPTPGCSIEISHDIGECRMVRYSSEPNTKVYGIRPHILKHSFSSNINSGCPGLAIILKPQ